MSSILHKMKKEIKQRNKNLILPQEMYTNLVGSFLISLKILGVYKDEDKELKKFYLNLKRELENKDLKDEETLLKDIAKRLDIKIPYGKIALVVSDYNMLVAPYVDLGEGKQILPLRPDGWLGPTLLNGKVYPLVGKKEVNIDENGKVDIIK